LADKKQTPMRSKTKALCFGTKTSQPLKRERWPLRWESISRTGKKRRKTTGGDRSDVKLMEDPEESRISQKCKGESKSSEIAQKGVHITPRGGTILQPRETSAI